MCLDEGFLGSTWTHGFERRQDFSQINTNGTLFMHESQKDILHYIVHADYFLLGLSPKTKRMPSLVPESQWNWDVVILDCNTMAIEVRASALTGVSFVWSCCHCAENSRLLSQWEEWTGGSRPGDIYGIYSINPTPHSGTALLRVNSCYFQWGIKPAD